MLIVTLLRSAAITVLAFLAVYLPAFAIAGILRLPPNHLVPVVMMVSFTITCVLIGLAIHRGWLSAVDFGLRWPARRCLAYSLIFAVPLSAFTAWALSHAREPGPLGGLNLTPALVYLYFAVGAPIQEEVIFRGLLQSTLARSLESFPKWAAASGIAASLAIAALFGLIHLEVGPFTALAALVLGVFAGELRRRSGSLLPAIVCHSIFNLGGILWALN
ncbi:MAG TPA: CPBP family intramembrane glutamic endopeptidase [Holophagaceae bacterium]|jgi:membrane protease YdiL (CAAX protease family)|nr:CPBP family intramembrane glutamic endopeptidase [Holophagaceae bacterium]